jgi:transcription antitermination factor NusG
VEKVQQNRGFAIVVSLVREEPIVRMCLRARRYIGLLVYWPHARKEGRSSRARARKTNKPIGCGGLAICGAVLYCFRPMVAAKRKFWSAAETEYKSESTARRSVQSIGIEVYFPMYRARAVGGVRKVLPLLDRYLLVRLDPRCGWSGIESCKGIRGLMRGADGGDSMSGPAQIPDENVEFIRDLEDELGYVKLESEDPPAFAFRDQVLALKGAFRDQRGEYRGIDQQNSRRAVIAFQVLGRDVVSSISRHDLARI